MLWVSGFFYKNQTFNVYFGSFDECVLVKILYGWKDLIESFPTTIFLQFFDLWLFFYVFQSFFGKFGISWFFHPVIDGTSGGT